MGDGGPNPRRALGLRLRLTLSYLILFSLLLLLLGLLFRETLDHTLYTRASDLLDEEWAAVKGYLRVEGRRPVWFFDRDDPEEAAIVQRLRRVLLLADPTGKVLEASAEYAQLGIESPREVQEILRSGRTVSRVRKSRTGEPFLVRAGPYLEGGKREFFLSIGRSLEQDQQIVRQFMSQYFSVVPLLVLAIGIAGWAMAGRALRPLNDVAQTAASITGSNLSLRIPLRNAGDELDHLIQRFNEMVDRLEQSFTQIRRFSIDVSHELRTPLTAIRGELEVALLTATTVEQYREAVMAAMEDCERLSKVVRALLQLSQAETGQVTLAAETLDLSALAAAVTDQFAIPAEEKEITLALEAAPGAMVLGDRIQLERLLSNLISNAIKYTPAKGKVTVSVVGTPAEVILKVADTGRGIPAEHQPHIFDRFYRVPDGDRDPEKGLGLGLSFVAWIAKAHHAGIHVDSTPQVGTTFTVSFPRAGQPAPPETEQGARIVA
jgi:heavy metal sensor kinase